MTWSKLAQLLVAKQTALPHNIQCVVQSLCCQHLLATLVMLHTWRPQLSHVSEHCVSIGGRWLGGTTAPYNDDHAYEARGTRACTHSGTIYRYAIK